MKNTSPLDIAKSHMAVVLVPQFSQMVFTLLSELLRIAELSGKHRFETVLCSVDGNPVSASNGGMQPIDTSIQDVNRIDAVIVCASYNPLDHLDARLIRWLRARYRHGSLVCGLDTGTFMLAEAGILKDKRATIHWDDLEIARHRYPDVTFTSALFECDGRCITSCGSLGTIEFTLELMAFFAGREIADYVLDQTVRGRVEKQMELRNPVLARATKVMAENIEHPVSIDQIAHDVGISTRQLSREFHTEFGVSPIRYYTGLRLDFADSLVKKTRFSLSEIALASGFGSLSWFSRSYKKRFSITPMSARHGGK